MCEQGNNHANNQSDLVIAPPAAPPKRHPGHHLGHYPKHHCQCHPKRHPGRHHGHNPRHHPRQRSRQNLAHYAGRNHVRVAWAPWERHVAQMLVSCRATSLAPFWAPAWSPTKHEWQHTLGKTLGHHLAHSLGCYHACVAQASPCAHCICNVHKETPGQHLRQHNFALRSTMCTVLSASSLWCFRRCKYLKRRVTHALAFQ